MYLAYPYRIDFSGRTATVDVQAYVQGLIESMLLTSPGERVNRPTYGGGLMQYVFAPADGQLVGAAETLIRTAVVQWLGDVLTLQSLTVAAEPAEIVITLAYLINASQQSVTQTVRHSVPGS